MSVANDSTKIRGKHSTGPAAWFARDFSAKHSIVRLIMAAPMDDVDITGVPGRQRTHGCQARERPVLQTAITALPRRLPHRVSCFPIRCLLANPSPTNDRTIDLDQISSMV